MDSMRGWQRAIAIALVLGSGLTCSGPASASGSQNAILATAGSGKICVNPPHCGDGAPATSAQLTFPEGVAFDRPGSVYIADRTDDEVRVVKAGHDPTIVRLAGTGLPCSAPPACGDGGPATRATLSSPSAVAVYPGGGVVVADTQDNEVRAITPDGIIRRIAGTGTPCTGAPNCGDGGPSVNAQLNLPQGVAVDSAGSVYIADGGDNEIRKVTRDGRISRIAGNGGICLAPPRCGDGGRATDAALAFPGGVAVDSSGNVYIADAGNNEIRRVGRNGVISRMAGTGYPCITAPRCGDGGPATRGALNFPDDLVWAPRSGVYVADRFDQEVRRISGGKISRVAGRGSRCQTPPACGDGGPALAARLNSPQGVAVDAGGNVWVGDSGNNQVRMVAPAGQIWRNARDRALRQYKKLGCRWPILGRTTCTDFAAQVLSFQAYLGDVRCFGRRRQFGQPACQIARPMVSVAGQAASAELRKYNRECPRTSKPRGRCRTIWLSYKFLDSIVETTLHTYS
jgi:hypothetical protein